VAPGYRYRNRERLAVAGMQQVVLKRTYHAAAACKL